MKINEPDCSGKPSNWMPFTLSPCHLVTLSLLFLAVGCHRPGAGKKELQTASLAPSQEAFDSARETFRKEEGIIAYRRGLQQLNTYIARNPDKKPALLTDSQLEFLVSQIVLDEKEQAEVKSPSFTALDAHYLDLCLVLRDAARELSVQNLPPDQQAKEAFGWVMRQVRLQERPGDAAPPQFVLRRGWGTALERSFVFLAFLQQLGIEGCLVTCPTEAGEQSRSRYWVPGALVDKKIYLFDTRLGLALPDPNGKDIAASLDEVRNKPEPILQALTVDDKHRYDVTPDMAKKAEVLVVWPLSALSARMKYLEAELAAQNKVNLAIDPATVQEKFAQAAKERAIPVRLATTPGDPNSPLRVLREFLPQSEGGTDESHRRDLFVLELIPRNVMPVPLRRLLSTNGILGEQLKRAFTRLFSEFPLPPPRNQPEQDYRSKLEQVRKSEDIRVDLAKRQHIHDDLVERLKYHFLTPTVANPANQSFVHHSLAPWSGRDDLLRGRLSEASSKLNEAQEQVNAQRTLLKSAPTLNENLDQWSQDAEKAQAALRESGGPNTQAFQDADKWVSRLWYGTEQPTTEEQPSEEGQPRIRRPTTIPVWLLGLLSATAEPLGADATYQLALCKQEQAERAQLRLGMAQGNPDKARKAVQEAWSTAADWWTTYLRQYSAAPGASAARRNLARVKEMLNDLDGAIALLKDLANVGDLEAVGRLVQARQLEARRSGKK